MSAFRGKKVNRKTRCLIAISRGMKEEGDAGSLGRPETELGKGEHSPTVVGFLLYWQGSRKDAGRKTYYCFCHDIWRGE